MLRKYIKVKDRSDNENDQYDGKAKTDTHADLHLTKDGRVFSACVIVVFIHSSVFRPLLITFF